MATDLTSLQQVIHLVADLIKDTTAAVAAGKSSWTNVLQYQNLVGDIFTVMPNAGTLPALLKSLTLADVEALIAFAVQELGTVAPNASLILTLLGAVLKDLGPNLGTDLAALISVLFKFFAPTPAPAPTPSPAPTPAPAPAPVAKLEEAEAVEEKSETPAAG